MHRKGYDIPHNSSLPRLKATQEAGAQCLPGRQLRMSSGLTNPTAWPICYGDEFCSFSNRRWGTECSLLQEQVSPPYSSMDHHVTVVIP